MSYAIPDSFRDLGLPTGFFAAHDAVVCLNERVRRSAQRNAWMQRLLFGEACAAQLVEGDLVHLEDLVLFDGYAYSGAPSIALSSTLEILKAWRAAEAADPSRALRAARPGLAGCEPIARSRVPAVDELAPDSHVERLEAWRCAQLKSRDMPPLIAAAIAWDAWLTLTPVSRSAWHATLLAALTLKACGLTSHLLLPIDIGWRLSKYRRHPNHDVATRLAGFLSWIEAAAVHGHKEFDSVTLAGEMLRSSLRHRRSNSRMPGLVDLLLERPFVSVPLAAKALRISRQAADAMLKQIGAPAHRLTERKRYNVWTIIG